MALFSPPGVRQLSVGIAIVRVVVGLIFIAHGYMKVFVWGFAGTTGAFTQMGAPLPGITAPLVAILEFFGGIALLAGFFTRPLALAFAADMLGAILLVRIQGGFFNPDGAEFEILLFAASVALAISGAGAGSVDESLARRRGSAVGETYVPKA